MFAGVNSVYYYDFEHQRHGQLFTQDLISNFTAETMSRDCVIVFEQKDGLDWLLRELDGLQRNGTDIANTGTPEYNKLHYELCYGFHKGHVDHADLDEDVDH